MKQIQLLNVTPDELKKEITTDLKNQLDEFLKNFKPKQPNEYYTRKEVADLFKVDISTIHNWCKSGRLKPLGIGNRVYFLRSDIDKCLTPLNS
ncbi:helix-turn-helix domain-containing protein [Vicingus serpentipes]|uniref:Helix-turn-helix domain-containing protein n=1 Tax=Vicingus serpentipes TaxID=1926625 RepID=A0A5C6RYI4_9FLAO|nr:helix-turn-helix domain-containing protein [Vicingus serpentipes]TXB66859.1 helix-turn-helix domain-containing protein [Vicingus serpentipes]